MRGEEAVQTHTGECWYFFALGQYSIVLLAHMRMKGEEAAQVHTGRKSLLQTRSVHILCEICA